MLIIAVTTLNILVIGEHKPPGTDNIELTRQGSD